MSRLALESILDSESYEPALEHGVAVVGGHVAFVTVAAPLKTAEPKTPKRKRR